MRQGADTSSLAYHVPLMLGSVPACTAVNVPKAIVKLAQIAAILAILMRRDLK